MTDVREQRTDALPTFGSGRSANGSGTSPVRERRPRRPRELTSTDVATILGSLVSSVCVCWLVFGVLTSGIGWLGFGLCAFAGFLALLWVATEDRLGATAATDRVVTAIIITSAVVILVPLVWLIIFVVVKGLPALRPNFFVEDQRGITPIMPSTAGGGAHAIVGTLLQVGLALLWSLPLGLLAAIFLNESRSRWRRIVRIVVDAMSGLPSIIAGLFIYAVFILPYAKKISLFSFNGFMASLALSLVMLPTITRTVEVVLRLVPDGLREAGLALGASRARTVWSVVLPTARTGMTTAVVLGIARAVGETAPLLFTALSNQFWTSDLSQPMASLPVTIFKFAMSPYENWQKLAWAGVFLITLGVLILNIVARTFFRNRI